LGSEPAQNMAGLTEAVAVSLHKLMAYKDEYEVARLALDAQISDEIAQQFGEGAKVQWRLHPPTLKSMALQHKIRLGSWFRPAFVLLRSLKGLRGTPFDLFGYDKMRRLERALIEEYTDSLRGILVSLHADNLETATAIAELPDMIRGYEEVKLRSVREYRERLVALQAEFAQPAHRRHTSAS